MNLSNLIRNLILYLALLVSPIVVLSQVEYHEVLVNDTLHYSFVSAGNAPQILVSPSNGDYTMNGTLNYPLGLPGLNELDYIPNTDYLGTDTIKILYYTDGPTGPSQSFVTLVIDVIESYVIAENDYAATSINAAVTLAPLNNDAGTGTLVLSDVPLANDGTVELSGGSVIFTPDNDFKGMADFTYTVCIENQNICDVATITVFVQDNATINDSTTIVTLKNQEIKALFPNSNGIQELLAPKHGVLRIIDGGIAYKPEVDFVGKDTFTYAYDINTVTSIATFNIDVLWAEDEHVLIVEDEVFTAENDSIEFNVLANDQNNDLDILTFTQSDEGGTVIDLGNGDFKYIPPTGFKGLDYFEYTAYISGTSAEETGKAYVIVNNQLPQFGIYDLSTPKNTPIVIDYDAPISNYEFSILEQGDFGDLVYYPGDVSLEVNGQDVAGYNLLVYYPDTDYIGSDNMQVEYCVGADCKVINVSTETVELANPQADSLCVVDCVRPGDIDRNGAVDMLDLLPLGYCVGEVGPERSNASTEWYGQFADDWNRTVGSTDIDIKNVDANGDGYISEADKLTILSSYGKYGNLTKGPAPVSTQVPLFFVPRTPNPGPGDKVIIDIILGIENLPATDVHGITFALNFNQEIVEPGTMEVTYEQDNWLSYESPMMDLVTEPYLGRVESGYTRATGVSKHGYGVLGQVAFIVVDDIVDGARVRDTLSEIFRPEAAISMNAAGEYIELLTHSFEIKIAQNIKEQFDDDNRNLIVFPNPTTDHLNIHVNGNNELEQVIVYSLTGKEVFRSSDDLSGKQTNITFNDQMPSGMYLITAICDKGVYTQKVKLMR